MAFWDQTYDIINKIVRDCDYLRATNHLTRATDMTFQIFCCFIFLQFSLQSDRLTPYLQDAKYGYADESGKLIIPAQYDEAEFFDETNSYAAVKQNDKWYVLNKHGEKLDGFELDCKPKIENLIEQNTEWRITFRLRNNQEIDSSLVSKNLRVLKTDYRCPSRSSQITVFNIENFKSVKTIELYDPMCSLAQSKYSTYTHKHLIACYINDKKSKTGGFEFPINKYTIYDDQLNQIANSSIEPKFLNESLIYYFENNQGFIYDINKKKKEKIPFNLISQMVDEKYFIVSNNNRGIQYGGRGYKYGLCDLDFNMLIDTSYLSLEWRDHNYLFGYKNGNTHIIDFDGNKLIDSIYNIHKTDGLPFFIVVKSLDNYAIYTDKLQRVDQQNYQHLNYNSKAKTFNYSKDNMSGILDSNLNLIIEYPSDRLYAMENSPYYIFTLNDKNGVIDHDKNELLPAAYKYCSYWGGFFRLKAEDKFGLADKSGKILLDTIYDDISMGFGDDPKYIKVEKNGQKAYFNMSMDTLSSFSSDRFTVKSVEDAKTFSQTIQEVKKKENESLEASIASFVKVNRKYLTENSLLAIQGEDKNIYAYKPDMTPISDSNKRRVKILKRNNESRLLSFELGGKQGIASYNNEIILPAGDHEIFDIQAEYIVLLKEKQYFLFDVEMKSLYPYGFDRIGSFYADRPLRSIGKKIPGSDYQSTFESCLTNQTETVDRFHNRYGYLDKSGHFALPPIYSYASHFEDGQAMVSLDFGKDSNERSNLIIDTSGNEIFRFKKGISIINWSPFGNVNQAKKDGQTGIIDSQGKEIISFKYKGARSIYKAKFFIVSEDDDSWHLINSNEKKIYSNMPIGYVRKEHYREQILPLHGDKYLVHPDSNFEIIDFDGKKYATFQGQEATIVMIDDREMIEVEDNGMKYYVDASTGVVFRN